MNDRLSHVLSLIPKRKPSNRRLDRSSFIYVIRCEEYVKVGIANDPVKRVNEMQTGNPFPLRLVFAWRTANAIAAERCLHNEIADKHHAGEWFKLTEAEVCALIESHPEIDALIPPAGEVY